MSAAPPPPPKISAPQLPPQQQAVSGQQTAGCILAPDASTEIIELRKQLDTSKDFHDGAGGNTSFTRTNTSRAGGGYKSVGNEEGARYVEGLGALADGMASMNGCVATTKDTFVFFGSQPIACRCVAGLPCLIGINKLTTLFVLAYLCQS